MSPYGIAFVERMTPGGFPGAAGVGPDSVPYVFTVSGVDPRAVNLQLVTQTTAPGVVRYFGGQDVICLRQRQSHTRCVFSKRAAPDGRSAEASLD
jgi:hypothetical protein